MGVFITGVGMTKFGKHPGLTAGELARQAVSEAVAADGQDLGRFAVFSANAAAGLLDGQEMIRGEVALSEMARGAPIFNVENACATSSSAFHLAVAAVEAGVYETAVVVGYEKMVFDDRRALDVLASAMSQEDRPMFESVLGAGKGKQRSIFTDVYAARARDYIQRGIVTENDLALVSVKNHAHGALNPLAQYGVQVTCEEVLESPVVASPLTRLMCAPVTDGAAAVVVRAHPMIDGAMAVRILATSVMSGYSHGPEEPHVASRAAMTAYEVAGVGPAEIDVAELHDASSIGEIQNAVHVGLTREEDVQAELRAGAWGLGGKRPVNPSGGLMSRGHPIGATGVAQLVELYTQLTGTAGQRQVEGARVGLAHNGGGVIGRPEQNETAVVSVTVLQSYP